MLRWPFRDCGLLVEKRIIQGSSCDDFPYVYYIGRGKKNEGEKEKRRKKEKWGIKGPHKTKYFGELRKKRNLWRREILKEKKLLAEEFPKRKKIS